MVTTASYHSCFFFFYLYERIKNLRVEPKSAKVSLHMVYESVSWLCAIRIVCAGWRIVNSLKRARRCFSLPLLQQLKRLLPLATTARRRCDRSRWRARALANAAAPPWSWMKWLWQLWRRSANGRDQVTRAVSEKFWRESLLSELIQTAGRARQSSAWACELFALCASSIS